MEEEKKIEQDEVNTELSAELDNKSDDDGNISLANNMEEAKVTETKLEKKDEKVTHSSDEYEIEIVTEYVAESDSDNKKENRISGSNIIVDTFSINNLEVPNVNFEVVSTINNNLDKKHIQIKEEDNKEETASNNSIAIKPDTKVNDIDKKDDSSSENQKEIETKIIIDSESKEANKEADNKIETKATFDSESKETDKEKPKENKNYLVFLALKKYLNKDFWKSFAIDTFFIIFCILFVIISMQKWFLSKEVTIIGTNQVHSSLESGEKTTIGNINVLVMGIDSVEGTHRSDTIFVLGINPSKNKITMISIPRDTRVLIENKGRKINEILPRYGEVTLRNILEDLLKINISRKVEIGFESFIGVIDAIGGVDINIEKAMNYDDNWGNLHIHFKKGLNHLDGENALRYVRFRKDAMADLGRIKRQQEFVKKVIEKLCSPACILRLPNIIETAFKYIKTDFTLQEILTVVKGFNDIRKIQFRTISLPGEPQYIDKISYFIPYSKESIEIGSSYFSDLAVYELEKDYKIGRIIPKQNKSNRKNR